MISYAELKAQAESLRAQAEEVRMQEMASVIADIKAKIEQYGITVYELFPGYKPKSRKSASKLEPKYCDPLSGDTWSGRGRKPAWVLRVLEQGRSLDELRIQTIS